MRTFVGAMEGKPRYRADNLRDLIVTTGGREATDPSDDSDSDSSDSDSSDSDESEPNTRSHRRHGDPVAPSASAVTTSLVPRQHDPAAAPSSHQLNPVVMAPAMPTGGGMIGVPAMPAPMLGAPAPMVMAQPLGVPAPVDWRAGVNPPPAVPQYAI